MTESISCRLPDGNKFDLNFESSDVPGALHAAAENLTGLAHIGFSREWQDCSDAEQIVASREAIALCRRALDEVELILDYSAARAADHFRSELARLEKSVEVTA